MVHPARKKPAKPGASFPLTAHPNGQWCKKIRGKVHFFGVWLDPDAALANYLRVAADLHAGRTVSNLSSLELTVKELGNEFLVYPMERVSSGQIGARWFEDCRRVVRQFAKSVGVSRPVTSLAAADFQRYRRLLVTEGLRGSRGLGVHALTRTITCLWYHVRRDVPIRLVIVRDPKGVQPDDFLFCTEASVPEAQIVQRFVDRWGVEEAIFESKQQLGFESTRGWCSKTVNRQTPLAMILLTLVKAWYASAARHEPSLLPQTTPWYGRKKRPSFLDMLSSLRGVLWRHRITGKSPCSRRVHRMIQTVGYALFAAA